MRLYESMLETLQEKIKDFGHSKMQEEIKKFQKVGAAMPKSRYDSICKMWWGYSPTVSNCHGKFFFLNLDNFHNNSQYLHVQFVVSRLLPLPW